MKYKILRNQRYEADFYQVVDVELNAIVYGDELGGTKEECKQWIKETQS
jgi:hypothetical protein